MQLLRLPLPRAMRVAPLQSAAMGSTSAARVLVVGAGGHARVCIEALLDSGLEVVGCVSADGTGAAGLPCPVLGRTADLAEVARRAEATHAFVAVGDNAAREQLANECERASLPLVAAVSRFAMVSASAHLGEGVAVLAGAVVNAAAVVGRGAILNTRSSVDHDNVVGDFAHVSVGVSLGGTVSIGARALVGVGSTVLPGIRVGDDAIVGGGAVVVRDVPAGATVVGVPAAVRS